MKRKKTSLKVGIFVAVIFIIGIIVISHLGGLKPLTVTGVSSSEIKWMPDSQNILYQKIPAELGQGICRILKGGVDGENTIYVANKIYVNSFNDIIQEYGTSSSVPTQAGFQPTFSGYCWNLPFYPSGGYITIGSVNYANNSKTLESCKSLGVISGIGYTKCNAYCKASQNTCVQRNVATIGDSLWEVHKCSSDGNSISKELCELGCNAGVCQGKSFTIYPLVLYENSIPDGFFGSDYKVTGRVLYNDVPIQNIITINLKQNGATIATATGFSDSTGNFEITVSKPTIKGAVDVEVLSSYRGFNSKLNIPVYFDNLLPITMSIAPQRSSYQYQEDLGGMVTVKSGTNAFSGATVNIKLLDSKNAVIKETRGVSDERGEIMFSLSAVEAIGNTKIVATTTVFGQVYTFSSANIFFEGNPFDIKVSTYSQIQYDTSPIKFIVNIKDKYGAFVSPDKITNQVVEATLTGGTVNFSSIKYIGSGDYEISSTTSGYGVFTGKMKFSYNSNPYSSQSITIEVRRDTVSVDTSSVPASAERNVASVISVRFASASGKLIDPTAVEIKVTHPSGIEVEIFSLKDLIRKSEGVYELNYNNFKEVEKYSFDIYADKSGYIRGNAKASLSVVGASGESGAMAGSPIIGKIVSNMTLIIVAIFLGVIGIFGYKRLKRRKKK